MYEEWASLPGRCAKRVDAHWGRGMGRWNGGAGSGSPMHTHMYMGTRAHTCPHGRDTHRHTYTPVPPTPSSCESSYGPTKLTGAAWGTWGKVGEASCTLMATPAMSGRRGRVGCGYLYQRYDPATSAFAFVFVLAFPIGEGPLGPALLTSSAPRRGHPLSAAADAPSVLSIHERGS